MSKKFFVIIVFIILSFVMCSKKKESNKKKMQNMISKQQKMEQDLYKHQEGVETVSSKKKSFDFGVPCKNHKYSLKPGTGKSLKFSIKVYLKSSVDTVDSVIFKDKLEAFNIEANLENTEVVEKYVQDPAWSVDDDAFSGQGYRNRMVKLIAFKNMNVWAAAAKFKFSARQEVEKIVFL